jgi:hypothetical protein
MARQKGPVPLLKFSVLAQIFPEYPHAKTQPLEGHALAGFILPRMWCRTVWASKAWASWCKAVRDRAIGLPLVHGSALAGRQPDLRSALADSRIIADAKITKQD